ncbi:MAG TPA: hypothetical protein VN711_02060 [Candidatus Saccharimonadales bacterium]|nr:hypothetical protein [Candidatus Saccharimonadales bacterium]
MGSFGDFGKKEKKKKRQEKKGNNASVSFGSTRPEYTMPDVIKPVRKDK